MRRKKTIVIVLIILAVLIVTPMLIWSVWCWSAQRELDAKLDELHQRGEPMTLVELAPPEIPDDQNAALLYEQAFALLPGREGDDRDQISRLGRRQLLLSEESLEEAHKLLTTYEGPLRLLRQGATRTDCRHSINWDLPPGPPLLEHIEPIQEGARLLALSAHVNLCEGKPDEAVRDCISILKLSRGLHKEPLVVLALVEKYVSQRGLEHLEVILQESRPSRRALQEALSALEGLADRGRLVLALKGERCFMLRNMPATLRPRMSDFLATVVLRPMSLNSLSDMLDILDDDIDQAAKPWHEIQTELKQKEDVGNVGVFELPQAIFASGMGRAIKDANHSIARVGLAKVAIALKLYHNSHRRYPDGVGELCPAILKKLPEDPFSPEGFVYRRTEDGFLLYSVGQNMIGDGGVEKPRSQEEGDIVWGRVEMEDPEEETETPLRGSLPLFPSRKGAPGPSSPHLKDAPDPR